MQVSRMARVRKSSCAASGKSSGGAMQGADGSAITVPGGTIGVDMGPRRRDNLARGIGLLRGHGRGKRDAFLDTRAELRVGRADEIAIALPHLSSLHDAKRFPPRIEAARRDRRLFSPRQRPARPGEKAFCRRDDFGIGLLKGVGSDDQSIHGSIDALARRRLSIFEGARTKARAPSLSVQRSLALTVQSTVV